MSQHSLGLDIPDTLNECVLKIQDSSIYASDLTVTCPILNVTPPGFTYSTAFTDLVPNFNVNLSACDLKIQTLNCGSTFAGLSDGIYIIKWSVAPNNIVYVEYNHLRITNALIAYQACLCKLNMAGCEPTAEVKKKLRELHDIKMYLLAAKAQVEYCHNPKKGMEIYTYANKLLKKCSCKTC